MIKAEFELKGVKEALENFSSKKVKQAIRSTLDKTGTQAKKEIVDIVSSDYNIAPKDVRDAIKVERTTQTSLETRIKIASKKLSLLYFKARQAPRGVLANVRKGTVSFYKSAFIVDKWHKAMIRTGRKRLPIEHRAGPSVTQIVAMDKIMDRIKAKMSKIMNDMFLEEIKKRIGR